MGVFKLQWTGKGGEKSENFVDVIYGWPLSDCTSAMSLDDITKGLHFMYTVKSFQQYYNPKITTHMLNVHIPDNSI